MLPSGAASRRLLPAGGGWGFYDAKSISGGVEDATSTQTNRCPLQSQREAGGGPEGTDLLSPRTAGGVIVLKFLRTVVALNAARQLFAFETIHIQYLNSGLGFSPNPLQAA